MQNESRFKEHRKHLNKGKTIVRFTLKHTKILLLKHMKQMAKGEAYMTQN
jgi:hypothetical protein